MATTKNLYKEITQVLECIAGADMDEEEFLKVKHSWFKERWLKAGYFKALRDLKDFWLRYGPGIKEKRLNNYRGIWLVLDKLIDYKHQFFELGGDIDLPFTPEELGSKGKDGRSPMKIKAGIPE